MISEMRKIVWVRWRDVAPVPNLSHLYCHFQHGNYYVNVNV